MRLIKPVAVAVAVVGIAAAIAVAGLWPTDPTGTPPTGETATPTSQPATETGAASGAAAVAATGDVFEGTTLARRRCLACHTFEAGEPHKVGPNLWNVMDRGIAAAEGFSYSAGYIALRDRGMDWTAAELMPYLADSTAWLRDRTGDPTVRSRMTYKMSSETDRAHVIAYLRTLQ